MSLAVDDYVLRWIAYQWCHVSARRDPGVDTATHRGQSGVTYAEVLKRERVCLSSALMPQKAPRPTRETMRRRF
ncbi:hypothetical protein PUN28_008435 [Cardiocondyla obscurior]|uniref:Transposase n=1 Tax=Cardiocondyla obscurior TaxID=286306 RepID=A0AAW2FZG0_9HYME